MPQIKEKKLSDITKQKLRVYRIKEIEEKNGQIIPNFNLNGSKFFNWLNKVLNWNGQHALNGGEYSVLGYFIDYYESNLNLVIEWDEKYHYKKGELKKKDIVRQQNIINHLDCIFIRIKEDEYKSYNEILNKIKKEVFINA